MTKARRTFARFLKEKRIKARLLQTQVGKQLGYSSAQFVSNWEREQALPPIDAMRTLIELYKVDPDEMRDLYLAIIEEDLRKVLKLKS